MVVSLFINDEGLAVAAVVFDGRFGSDDNCSFRQAIWALMDYGRLGRQSTRRDLGELGSCRGHNRKKNLPTCLLEDL